MPEAEYVRFKDGAGFIVRGSTPVDRPSPGDGHMRRSFYIISQLESPRWGGVQNYDKAGMSAGPLHVTAVLPTPQKQGKLWELVSMLFVHCAHESKAVQRLQQAIDIENWVVTQTGAIVHRKTGKRIEFEVLRTRLSAAGGQVPVAGPKYDSAKHWAMLFHEAFADPCTYRTQELYTIQWLARGQQTVELSAYSKYMPSAVGKRDAYNYVQYATQQELGHDLDLAMIVYHAFSVNGPAQALAALRSALLSKTADLFAASLIKNLGTTSYGKWRDTLDNKNRYDKTRLACLSSGYWDEDRLHALMPENIK
jgi:hypothetical protein